MFNSIHLIFVFKALKLCISLTHKNLRVDTLLSLLFQPSEKYDCSAYLGVNYKFIRFYQENKSNIVCFVSHNY
jgi:hypothetical protein